MTTTLCVLFFFFQAEDGIRDLIVTGVQTCALPIYTQAQLDEFRQMPWIKPDYKAATLDALSKVERYWRRYSLSALHHQSGVRSGRIRSEERRVGKECRSRWSPYH